jgi:hypothetical protein
MDPQRYLYSPQPSAVDDQRINGLDITVYRQLFDGIHGKALKKTRPRRIVDYVAGWNGLLSVVCRRFVSLP